MNIEFTEPRLSDILTKTVVIGDNGDGKSTTALRLAAGIAHGGRVLVIDTDNGRGSLNAGRFKFQTYRLGPPYNGDHYAEAIMVACEKYKPSVLVIDTVSEEQAEMVRDHDRHLDQAWERAQKRRNGPGCEEWQFREKMAMSAWAAAKTPRKNLLYCLRSLRCHLVVAMRCGLKVNVNTHDSELALEGYTRFCSDATATFLLKPNGQGTPNWSPPMELAGCTKMLDVFREDESIDWHTQLSERHGAAMAFALRDTTSQAFHTAHDSIGSAESMADLETRVREVWPKLGLNTRLALQQPIQLKKAQFADAPDETATDDSEDGTS